MLSLQLGCLEIFGLPDELGEYRDVLNLLDIDREDMLNLMVGQFGELCVALLQLSVLSF